MALATCPICGNLISDSSSKCKYCGNEVKLETTDSNPVIKDTYHQDETNNPSDNLTEKNNELAKIVSALLNNSSQSTDVPTIPTDEDNNGPKETEQQFEGENHVDIDEGNLPSRIGTYVSVISSENKGNRRLLIWITILAVGILGLLIWGFILTKDDNAPCYYVFADNLKIRSSNDFDVEYNVIKTLPYGTRMLVYDDYGDSYYGKVKPIDRNGKVVRSEVLKGYVSAKYMMSQKDFVLTNSIFGNEEAQEMLSESRYKRALLDYYKQRGYIGNLTKEEIQSFNLDYTLTYAERWQVFCKDEKSTSNNVYRSRKWNKYSKYTDVAIIINNIDNGQRKLLFFIFDDDETPHLLCEQQVYSNGYMIDGTLHLRKEKGNYTVKVNYTYESQY